MPAKLVRARAPRIITKSGDLDLMVYININAMQGTKAVYYLYFRSIFVQVQVVQNELMMMSIV
jgi:hypothetical protein